MRIQSHAVEDYCINGIESCTVKGGDQVQALVVVMTVEGGNDDPSWPRGRNAILVHVADDVRHGLQRLLPVKRDASLVSGIEVRYKRAFDLVLLCTRFLIKHDPLHHLRIESCEVELRVPGYPAPGHVTELRADKMQAFVQLD